MTEGNPDGHRSGNVTGLIADRRARVPFALIGVLLLVTSTAYALGVAEQGLVGEDRSVERAVERVEADTTTALKTAAREASHDAAAEPVTAAPSRIDGVETGADGTTQQTTDAVRSESAFEDALRIRLAIAAAESLSNVETNVGEVSASASMAGADEPDELAEARDRVSIEPVADGTAIRVTFAEVRTVATRDGRTVADRTADRTVVVDVPILGAHERTERFEKRLNSGPVEGPGLGRQLTASLYPMTWARGYAQYAGAPVRNVLANRHVELATNAGVVRTQRDVFGAADPSARGGLARATAETGVADVLEPTDLDEEDWAETVLDAPTPDRDAIGTGDGRDPSLPGADPEGGLSENDHADETTSVAVDHAADVGLTRTTEEMDRLLREAHRVEATLEAEGTRVEYGGRLRPPSPGSDWRRVDRRTSSSLSVSGEGTPTGVPSGTVEPRESVSFGDATREVVVERRATADWEREVERRDEDGEVTTVTQRRTTRDRATDRYRVDVSVTGEYAPTDPGPSRRTATFGASGSDAEPDLSDTPETARADLNVADASGVDRIARRAVSEGDVTESTTVVGARPDDAEERITADLIEVHEEVRGIETETRMGDVAGSEADPHGTLASQIETKRMALADPPERYDGAIDRGRLGVRIYYIDAVIEELESASEDQTGAVDRLFDRIESAFGGPSIGEVIASKEKTRDVEPHAVGADGPGGEVRFVPEGSPGYLPRTAIDGADVDGVDGTETRPLATRNLNYVTVPYDDISGGIVDRILGTEETVGPGVAGRALVTADAALEASGGPDADPDLRADRDVLAYRLDRSLMTVDRELVDAAADRTDLSETERRDAVEAVTDSYGSTGEHALHVGNGSHADRVANELAARDGLSRRDEVALGASLRVSVRTAAGRDAVRVPARFVDETTDEARDHVRDRLEDAAEDGTERAVEEASERWAPEPVRRVGAGLPVAPTPGYWVATVNAWQVEVRGEYPAFTVHADVGSPGRSFEYVRTAGKATVTVGDTEIVLGETEPVRFETGTLVVIAVPPGPPGVGDVDGTRDETSDGWPCPGVPAGVDGASASEGDDATGEPWDGECDTRP
ncbi:DUF7286 family protein [Halorubrum vacuolatum]|uniref:Uncharacterized protein n=1 Tax=Halorubrum vacuolatum TaxID=63740 RepID=A0A238X4G9_HALVU|nr:hypothetical protein [Halorubrum vacuolatum]SNR53491.1 hypothetical protein SAMN06264855_11331 [Halorubrum vacuolatum]